MTLTQAKDELFGIVATAIAASAIPTIETHWPSMPITVPPPTNDYWARVFFTIAKDAQSSLAKQNGVSRYTAIGTLIMTIYSPISVVGSSDIGVLLADAVRVYFRRPSPSGIITFTNQQVRELGNTDTHFQTNVIVTCTYDHIQ